MTYRAAIVGAGAIAGLGQPGFHDDSLADDRPVSSHAGGYEATDGVELVAVSDPNQSNLDRFGEVWGVPPESRYRDHEELFAAEPLDVVSICSPTFLHHRHCVDAMHVADPAVVWCEKPIASSLSEADEIIDVAATTDTDVVVNHSYRFMEKVNVLRSLLRDDGVLGDIRSVHARLSMELLRNGTHLVDTVSYVCGTDPAFVSGYFTGEEELDAFEATGDVDDSGGGGFVVTRDGTFVTIDATTSRRISTFCFLFVGTAGKMYLNFDDGEWRYWTLRDGAHVEAEFPEIDGAWTWTDDYPRAFPNAARHVVELLDGEAENRSSATDGAKALEQIIGFCVSDATASHVSLPIENPLRDVHIQSW